MVLMLDEYRSEDPRLGMSKQVLLINITRMGDLVQMGTLLQRLQHEWPGAAVDLVVDQRFASVASLLPRLRQPSPTTSTVWSMRAGHKRRTS